MRIYFGIDGTKNFDDTPILSGPVPSPEIAQSYVNRIALMGFDRFDYIGGPKSAITGKDTAELASEAVSWVQRRIKLANGKPCKVYLGGFSRGGAAVVNAAYQLNKKGIEIDAIFLMDAVDRTYSIPFWTVWDTSKNVRVVFHALRASSSDSRPGFSNIVLRKNCISRSFHTTHGGMGGWPIDYFSSVNAKQDSGFHKTSTPSAILPTSRLVAGEKLAPGIRRQTNVSKIEQLSGSMAVWNWMKGCVQSVRV